MDKEEEKVDELLKTNEKMSEWIMSFCEKKKYLSDIKNSLIINL